MSPRPGILLQVSVTRLSSSPAMAKLCPLSSSISVCTRRVDSAGMLKPWKTQAVGEVERTDFRRHLQADGAARRDVGQEVRAVRRTRGTES